MLPRTGTMILVRVVIVNSSNWAWSRTTGRYTVAAAVFQTTRLYESRVASAAVVVLWSPACWFGRGGAKEANFI